MKDNELDRKHIEILAPAGSYESFRTAIIAGADAVYAGGPRFGARAFADNFTEEELLQAIDFAHLHGRKLYLTVNTLLKDQEILDLYDYLYPLYCQGLDAVIVQDVGVLSAIKKWFPEMEIHASTQITITNTEGALFLKECGVSRVVPARELSLDEVHKLTTETGLEIECFVHGALCYCYSGQCLLSSMIGGRSGNRGQCAQPCRLPYTVNNKTECALSLKDICTVDMIPKMIEAGIHSFKIEGRMKKPEYVALVTSLYRKYVDLYFEQGRAGFSVSKEDKDMLLDIYNRGGFSDGYYEQHNGAHMVSLTRSNHAGVPAVKVVGQRGREAVLQAITNVYKGDVLELTEKKGEQGNYTFGKDLVLGEKLQILLPKGLHFSKGTVLSRIRNQKLLDAMKKQYIDGSIQENIEGRFSAVLGKPAVLTLSCRGITVSAKTTCVIEPPKNHPVDVSRVEQQLKKTGGTEFVFDVLKVSIPEDVFIPMQQLNELRREALSMLQTELQSISKRAGTEQVITKDVQQEESITTANLTVLVETKDQLDAVLECNAVACVYLEISTFCESDIDLKLLSREVKQCGKQVYLALPHIFRNKTKAYLTNIYTTLFSSDIDGVLIRNYESYRFLRKQGFDKELILDHNLYVFNACAKSFWSAKRIQRFTAPLELNHRELKHLGILGAELIVYGYLPVMVSAQCVQRTTVGCTGNSGSTLLKDRFGEQFLVRRCCQFCYTVMNYSKALCLFHQSKVIDELKPGYLRMQFTSEGRQEIKVLLKQYESMFCNGERIELEETKFTEGHFKRGIT